MLKVRLIEGITNLNGNLSSKAAPKNLEKQHITPLTPFLKNGEIKEKKGNANTSYK